MNHTNTNASPLAPEIEVLISRVVRRARLRRGERRDVERELRSHFAAGIAEGKTVEEMVAEFGDAKASARLIGRAKRRCRGVVWQAFVWARRGVMGLFALVVVTYAWAAWSYYGAEPTITRNVLKEMNDPIRALPSDQCALPEYEAVYWGFPKDVMDRIRTGIFAIPGSEEWQERSWAMDQLRPVLGRVREASTLPHLGMTLSIGEQPEGPTFDAGRAPGVREQEAATPAFQGLLPAVSTIRFVQYALGCEAQDCIDRGDADLFVADIGAVIAMCKQLPESGILVMHLISVSHAQRSLSIVREALAENPKMFTDEHLRSLAHDIGSAREALRTVPIENERLLMIDAIQRAYVPGPFGVSVLGQSGIDMLASFEGSSDSTVASLDHIAESLLRPGVSLISATREESESFVAQYMDRVQSDVHMDPGDAGALSLEAFLDAFEQSEIRRWRHWFVLQWVTAIDRSVRENWRFQTQSGATLAVLAAEVFRREHDRWPTSWDELVPSYLPEVPIDMFDGQPLRMSERDGRWFIYSIGVDRDDNGGRVPVNASGELQPAAAAEWMSRESFAALPDKERLARAGDWILWPPVDQQTGEFVVSPR